MSTPLKQRAHQLLHTCGHDIVEYPLPDWLVFKEHLLHVFRAFDINVVLDVGAHFGEYATFLRESGYRGHIVSIEPIQENFDILTCHARGDLRWTAHRLALGTSESPASINVSHCTDFSSFLSPNDFCGQRFGEKGRVERTELVPMKRLDAILDDLVTHVENPRIYLKIDTQGWDLNVLRGAAGVLQRVLALQSEVSVQNIYCGMTSYLDAIREMSDLGFSLSGLFPVCQAEDGITVVEFDCVMVRPNRTIAREGAPAA
jgi:FkbM family methyltransferase